MTTAVGRRADKRTDTYTTENNGTNTIPAVNVKYATLVSAASS